jgi:hypothetical protein
MKANPLPSLEFSVRERFSTAIREHLKAEEARLNDPALGERYNAILEGFDQATANGIEPSPWLIHATRELYAELDWQIAKQARIIAELDRWIDFETGKALEKN